MELPEQLKSALGQMTREEEDAILASYLGAQNKGWDFGTFEELVTSPDGFGLVSATPLQRAVCRAACGISLGDVAAHPHVLEALGVADVAQVPAFRGIPPRDIFLIAAIRAAKSTFAAASAVWASQTVDISMLSSGEIPRFPILSLSKDNAGVVMGHLLGALAKPRLKHLRIPKGAGNEWREIIEESGSDAVSSVFLWHPSGRPMEVCIVAGKRAGASAISRWLFGMCLDEAPRMLGADDAVVNYEDSKRGARGRLLPKAQVWSIGSPYQPYGPVYDEVTEHWGHPTVDKVIFKARGPLMNPVWWTEKRCAELKKTDPVAYQTDVLAEFADILETLFSQAVINRCSRPNNLPIPYDAKSDYEASMDPATRSNAWTLVIASRQGRRKRVVFSQQWQGTSIDPLSPKAVLIEVKAALADYHLDWTYSDQWSADAIRDLGAEMGLNIVIEVWSEKERVNCYLSLAENMKEGLVELPNDPQFHKDLKLTKKKPTNRGPSIHLTKTTDGRHCDYAPAVARVMKRWLDEEQPEGPVVGSPEHQRAIEDEMEKLELEAFERKKDEPWWDKDPWEGQYEQ